jgi:hypothetical protein
MEIPLSGIFFFLRLRCTGVVRQQPADGSFPAINILLIYVTSEEPKRIIFDAELPASILLRPGHFNRL